MIHRLGSYAKSSALPASTAKLVAVAANLGSGRACEMYAQAKC
jgi:hypothetical protein